MSDKIRSIVDTVKYINDSNTTPWHHGFKKFKSLIWFDDYDVGWYPVIEDGIYDEKYLDNYISLSKTGMGGKISRFRSDFVRQYTCMEVIDIGAGAGQFVQMMNTIDGRKIALGYDVNPASVELLKKKDIYIDVRERLHVQSLTFWDSLEHINEFWELLSKIEYLGYAFVTIPIVRSCSDVKRSKHFKPREHYWYFTYKGFIRFMEDIGFKFLADSNEEEVLGREEVMSFAFQKICL